MIGRPPRGVSRQWAVVVRYGMRRATGVASINFTGGYFITGGQFITERKRVGSWWWWWPVVAAAASASINFTREVYHEEKTSVIPLLAAAAAATARHREICIPQAPVFNAPYSVGISQKCLIVGKLEWLGYHSLKKVWWYVKLFRYNSGAWQTDRRTKELLYQYRAVTNVNKRDFRLFAASRL